MLCNSQTHVAVGDVEVPLHCLQHVLLMGQLKRGGREINNLNHQDNNL